MIATRSIPLLARLFGRAVLALAAVAATPVLAAQPSNWPDGPITFITPFEPGGGGDVITRLFANELGKIMSASFIVLNMPGAGGNIGTAHASRATPNGNTVVFGTNGTMGTNHFIYKRTGYSIDDFSPVALFEFVPLAMVVGKDSQFHSVGEIIAYAEKHPGELTCASGGNGTASHVACEMLQQMAHIKVTHIPYTSSLSAYTDMISGRLSFMIDVVPPLISQIRQGNLRALAVSMKQRIPALPDTPTIAQTVPGYELSAWDGMFAPKGSPAARLDKLHDAVAAAINDPAFRKIMESRGEMPTPMSRQEFADFVKKEYDRMGPVIRKMGITIN